MTKHGLLNILTRLDGDVITCADLHILTGNLNVAIRRIERDTTKGIDFNIAKRRTKLHLTTMRRHRQFIEPKTVTHVDTARHVLHTFELATSHGYNLCQGSLNTSHQFRTIGRIVKNDMVAVGRHDIGAGILQQIVFRRRDVQPLFWCL